MAKYKIIPSSRTIVQSPISIGHKAEKGVEAIEFDLTAWVETYGSGTLTVIMRRWGDAIPYPIALEIDENNKATWTLSDIDTAKAGMAYAQLNYIVGDEVVKKSDIYTFRVMDSLTGEGDPPEAYESWLEHLTHLAAEAMAEVLDIEGVVTDKTLTVDGGIADGKATGDALALKADKSTTYTKAEVDQMIEDVTVETDTTLAVSGAPADAKATGDALGALEDQFSEETDQLKADLGALDPGLSQQARAALLTCFRHVRWHDDDEDYYAALAAVLQIDDPTRPMTTNVPQVGPKTGDGFVALYGSIKDHRGIIVSSNSAAGHTIPYYNESQRAYDAESPYYPIPIPIGAQECWVDGAIEGLYAYSNHIVQWNANTGKWDIAQPGQFIWTDALVASDTPHSQLTPYHQDISAFNDGTYYMVIGIGKTIGTTTWKDNEGTRETFPNGAYFADMDATATGIVDTSIANLALRFSF